MTSPPADVVGDLGALQHLLDVVDLAFQEPLLALGVVVVEVLAQVAHRPGVFHALAISRRPTVLSCSSSSSSSLYLAGDRMISSSCMGMCAAFLDYLNRSHLQSSRQKKKAALGLPGRLRGIHHTTGRARCQLRPFTI